MISPSALLVQKHLQYPRLKTNMTLTLLVPMRLKLLLENKQTRSCLFQESNPRVRYFPFCLVSDCPAGDRHCCAVSDSGLTILPDADNRIKEHNAIKLSVGDYDDGAGTAAVTALVPLLYPEDSVLPSASMAPQPATA